jgi:ribokinase
VAGGRIHTLGSINADHTYRVPRLPRPGETLAASHYHAGLGGKGANQSIAAARAGARVVHLGAVGPDGTWMVRRLAAEGIDTTHVVQAEGPSGHAIIHVDDAGENAITLYPGANRLQDPDAIAAALDEGRAGDWLLLQNETSHQRAAADRARGRGMSVAYSAAAFDPAAVQAILPHVTLLILNAVEAAQLGDVTGMAPKDLPVANVLVTKGPGGADWIETAGGASLSVPAPAVTPVDTTGAGDCFAGYAVAGLAQGLDPRAALQRAAQAAALQVQRPGAAAAIPSLDELD